MNDLGMLQVVLLVLLSFVSSMASTAIGFGMNIILVAVFQFIMPPLQLVGLVTILGTINAAARVIESRKINTGGTSGRVIIPGVLAVPIGTALLCHADPDLMKVLFSIVILISSIRLMCGGTGLAKDGSLMRNGKISQVFFGAVGGFTGGATGMPGPPVVWCGLRQDWGKAEAHAVFARFFLATGIGTAAMLWWLDGYGPGTVVTGMALLPVIGLGVVTGSRLRLRISQEQFRRYAMVGLVVLALAALANTVVL